MRRRYGYWRRRWGSMNKPVFLCCGVKHKATLTLAKVRRTLTSRCHGRYVVWWNNHRAVAFWARARTFSGSEWLNRKHRTCIDIIKVFLRRYVRSKRRRAWAFHRVCDVTCVSAINYLHSLVRACDRITLHLLKSV